MATFASGISWNIKVINDTVNAQSVKTVYTVPIGSYAFLESIEPDSGVGGDLIAVAINRFFSGGLSDEFIHGTAFSPIGGDPISNFDRLHYFFTQNADTNSFPRVLYQSESVKLYNALALSRSFYIRIMEFTPNL